MLAKDAAADHCYNYLTDFLPMSEVQLKAFLEKVQIDTSLQEKLKAAKLPEEVVSVAKHHGHEFTAEWSTCSVKKS